MARRNDDFTCRFRPGIKWVVELMGVGVLDPACGKTMFLGYPQAAAWDLVSRGLPLEQVVRMLGAIAALNEEEARELLDSLLDEWFEAGFLVREENRG